MSQDYSSLYMTTSAKLDPPHLVEDSFRDRVLPDQYTCKQYRSKNGQAR